MSQLNTTRSGGSKARIRAHRHSLPSAARSTMLPPTRGSNTVSAIGAPSMLCSGGLKSPNRSVNTVKARSIGVSTTTCLRTVAASVWVIKPPPSGASAASAYPASARCQ